MRYRSRRRPTAAVAYSRAELEGLVREGRAARAVAAARLLPRRQPDHGPGHPAPGTLRRGSAGKKPARLTSMEALAESRLRAPHVAARWLGRVSYDRGLALQREAAGRAIAGGDESLLLLEHDPVFTLGRNASRDDVLWGTERLEALAIALRESDRGGKVTYHGPGQLVGYPILRLEPGRRDVKRYVHDLEEVLIRTLAELRRRGDALGPPRARHVGLGRQREDRGDRDPRRALGHDARLRAQRHRRAARFLRGHRPVRDHRRRRHFDRSRDRIRAAFRRAGPTAPPALRGRVRPPNRRPRGA